MGLKWPNWKIFFPFSQIFSNLMYYNKCKKLNLSIFIAKKSIQCPTLGENLTKEGDNKLFISF